jgi:hypothetical protein
MSSLLSELLSRLPSALAPGAPRNVQFSLRAMF